MMGTMLRADLPAVAIMVVAEMALRWPADPASDGRHGVERGQELSDVVAVAAGQVGHKWGAVSVGDQVVFGAGSVRSTGDGPVWLLLLTP
jgi:hypothetical protein